MIRSTSSRTALRAGVARVCTRMRARVARICAQAQRAVPRDAILHQRGAQRLPRAILEHASPVLGSGLSKIGQTGDLGIVTPRRGRGRGARGTGFVWGRGALVSPPQRPCQPWAGRGGRGRGRGQGGTDQEGGRRGNEHCGMADRRGEGGYKGSRAG